jgi:hypothetical protein
VERLSAMGRGLLVLFWLGNAALPGSSLRLGTEGAELGSEFVGPLFFGLGALLLGLGALSFLFLF